MTSVQQHGIDHRLLSQMPGVKLRKHAKEYGESYYLVCSIGNYEIGEVTFFSNNFNKYTADFYKAVGIKKG